MYFNTSCKLILYQKYQDWKALRNIELLKYLTCSFEYFRRPYSLRKANGNMQSVNIPCSEIPYE